MIREKIDKILDSLPEEELDEVYWSIYLIYQEYLFKQNLREKGVIIELVDEGEKIIDLWDYTFSQNIGKEIKNQIFYEQFKWHIFSYKKQECLEKAAARKAFDSLMKNDCYIMYQDSPIVYLYKNAKNIKSTDFDSQQDIYIFDKDFTWTYVHTHEEMCGPYFYKIN